MTSAVVSIRPAIADVLSVTSTPAIINQGDPFAASAEIFNTANVTRNLFAQIQILDAAGAVVATHPDVPVSLMPGAGDLDLNLGQIATTGLADGVYTLQVSLLTSVGTPLPGQSSETDFEIGQPVTASIAASSPIVAPGNSTITTTISVTDTNAPTAPASSSAFTVGDIQAFYLSKEAQTIFGVAPAHGAIIVIEDGSSTPITDGVLTVDPPGGPEDQFNVGTVPAGQHVLIEPGISNDGGTAHTFFKVTGTLLDESKFGPNGNDVQFEFTGTQGTATVDSGVFTPAATAGPSTDGTVPDLNFLGGPGDLEGSLTDGFGPKVVASLTATPAGGSTSPTTLPVAVEVGYADNLRPNPYLPDPWFNSPNVIFDGYRVHRVGGLRWGGHADHQYEWLGHHG